MNIRKEYLQFLKGKKKYAGEEKINAVPHGCAIVFTPKFFEKLTGFCDETFMYFEEDILYCDIIKNGLKTVFSPLIYILHLEQISTDNKLGTKEKKYAFVIDQMERSIKVLERKIKGLPPGLRPEG